MDDLGLKNAILTSKNNPFHGVFLQYSIFSQVRPGSAAPLPFLKLLSQG
jgi:hypothetical protein